MRSDDDKVRIKEGRAYFRSALKTSPTEWMQHQLYREAGALGHPRGLKYTSNPNEGYQCRLTGIAFLTGEYYPLTPAICTEGIDALQRASTLHDHVATVILALLIHPDPAMRCLLNNWGILPISLDEQYNREKSEKMIQEAHQRLIESENPVGKFKISRECHDYRYITRVWNSLQDPRSLLSK